jgi:hypothetical protein
MAWKRKKKICFRCKEEIFNTDHYFEFIEMLDEIKIRTDYAHKKCWDEVKSDLSLKENLNNALNDLSSALGTKKEFVIE